MSFGYLKNTISTSIRKRTEKVDIRKIGHELSVQIFNGRARIILPVDTSVHNEVEELFVNGKSVHLPRGNEAFTPDIPLSKDEGEISVYAHLFNGDGEKGIIDFKINRPNEIKLAAEKFFKTKKKIEREGKSLIEFLDEKDRALYRKGTDTDYFDVFLVVGFKNLERNVKVFSNYEVKVDKTDGTFYLTIPLDRSEVMVEILAYKEIRAEEAGDKLNKPTEQIKLVINNANMLYPDGIIPWGNKVPDYQKFVPPKEPERQITPHPQYQPGVK